jgi:predicted RNase H-like nuclease (RuvC/YqgF family)
MKLKREVQSEQEKCKEFEVEVKKITSRAEDLQSKMRGNEANAKREMSERDDKLEKLIDELRERDSLLDKQSVLHKGLQKRLD